MKALDSKIALQDVLIVSNRAQSIIFGLAALTWCVFLPSTLKQTDLPWQSYLIAVRILLILSATGLAVMSAVKTMPRALSLYFTMCMAFQASFACLEPAQQIEYYQYIFYFLLLQSLAFNGSFRRWLVVQAPMELLCCIVPLFFKDGRFFVDAGTIAFTFTTPIALSFLSILTFKINSARFAAQKLNQELQNQLLASERVFSDRLRSELEIATIKMQKDENLSALVKMGKMLAHDMKEPFMMLKMALTTVKGVRNPERFLSVADKLLPRIDISISHIENMLQDYLQFQASGTQAALNNQVFSLDEAVKSALELSGWNSETARSRVTTVCSPLTIESDQSKIQRILGNLLSNAFDAVATGDGRVEVVAGRDSSIEGWIELRVSNTGPTISDEIIGSIFEPSFTQGKRSGTGLGLTIVKQFTQHLGGHVSCSVDPNQTMTVFTVKFPVAAIRDQVEAESLEVKTRVAALDDEPFYLDSLQELIVNDDSLASRIDFKGFDSPGSLLSQRTGFDAAILDYRLSDQEISGIDVARQLRREGFRGPIVMNSSGQIPAEEIADQSLQPLTFAPKPLNAASIVSLLALARSGSYRTATVSRGQ